MEELWISGARVWKKVPYHGAPQYSIEALEVCVFILIVLIHLYHLCFYWNVYHSVVLLLERLPFFVT